MPQMPLRIIQLARMSNIPKNYYFCYPTIFVLGNNSFSEDLA